MSVYTEQDKAFLNWIQKRREALHIQNDSSFSEDDINAAWQKEDNAWANLQNTINEEWKENNPKLWDLIERIEQAREEKRRELWDNDIEKEINEWRKQCERRVRKGPRRG